MPQPQPAIVPEPGSSAYFLVLQVHQPALEAGSIAQVLAGVPVLSREIAAEDAGAGLVCNVAFGPGFWDAVCPGQRPAGLRPFQPQGGPGRMAPATGGDVFIHVTSGRHDLNFELVRRIVAQLGDRVEVLEEVAGFRYKDFRDLTGFIDGTENPKGEERSPAALIGDEDATFAGGSYAFTQRYIHDLKRWATVPVHEQEVTIGRSKPDSEELGDKPATAHISRVVIEEEGEELQIVRHSFPYGSVGEAGLFFVAYCRTLDIPERMLGRMMGTAGDGLHDHLMDFVQAVSGANFFAPSLEMLQSLKTVTPATALATGGGA